METRFELNQIRESTDLVGVLSKLGHEPIKKSGAELFYLSPLRDNDSAPSFCVNERSGLWYDHGMGKGGSVIEFALAYWFNLSFKEAITELLKLSGQMYGELAQRSHSYKQTSMSMREPSYIIRGSQSLGNNPSITAYLKSRGIFDVAVPFLKELQYSIKMPDKSRKELFAAAWQNELGGWEIRSPKFKGCLDKKAMNYILGDNSSIKLFEGMMDFLSWKKLFPEENSSILILNSLSFIEPAIERAKEYSSVDAFFDHDTAGRKATDLLLRAIPNAIDKSGLYAGYNDFNEKLQVWIATEHIKDFPLKQVRTGPIR
ncbi:toprim domain-containing protein [Pedobacter aquatilis]|uniref:toprim domain-containing protein n=1 Tax=Pedobacter aquatilis TaxID=351343 RepID=UPI0025B54C09|nr:toprim domain-containing protein [Pedobacter aquatilis]MDN3586150.1 toprim domain-containing protein [Pedobacter aquatilis]